MTGKNSSFMGQETALRQHVALAETLSRQEHRRMMYWNQFDPFLGERVQWRAAAFRHLFHILPGQKILEVGAGNGQFTRALNQALRGECEITAAVFSEEYGAPDMRKVRTRYLRDFPGALAGERFDYIVAHHMLDNQTRNGFLRILKNLLNPGGGLLLFEPNPWNPYYRLRRVVQGLIPIRWKRPAEPVSLNRLQIFQVFSELGFTHINALAYDFLYSPVPRFLLWPAKHLSLILENCPYVRNFAGSLLIWARNGEPQEGRPAAADLCEHEAFSGKVSFVVPCHNEEENVLPLLRGLLCYYGRYVHEIIVVDDCSQDRTAELAEEFGRAEPRVRVIRRDPPHGVGRALRDGLKEAHGEYVALMDCDFHHLIPEIRDLFDALAAGADVVIGSRFSRESVLLNYPFTKILANRAFHVLANLCLGQHVRDVTNNLKIFKREAAERLQIEFDDFAANAETGFKPLQMGYQVREVPISWMNRSIHMGLSSFKIARTGPSYARLLLRLTRRRFFPSRGD